MERCIEQFIEYIKNEKNRSDNTVQSYKRDLEQYRAYLQSSEGEAGLGADGETFARYVACLQQQGKAPATISRCIASVRAFYRYLCIQDICQCDPTAQMHALKCEKKLPQILTSREVNLLLEQPSLIDMKGIRDKAMLELLYATGIRVTELISLNVADVNTAVGYITCRGSQRERVIPLYQQAVDALKKYYVKIRPMMIADERETALFVNAAGKRLTRQGFWKIVKQYKAQARIKKELTPHTLRHSFAAHLLANGADLKSLQEMMGHADISSTQIYAGVVKDKLTSVYKNAHPRSNGV